MQKTRIFEELGKLISKKRAAEQLLNEGRLKGKKERYVKRLLRNYRRE